MPLRDALLSFLALVASGAALAAAPGADHQFPWGPDASAGPAFRRVAAISALGQQIFFDRGLSASGAMSCASCHDPQAHFSPPNARSVQLGGPTLKVAGTRATPGLTYQASTPFFTEHFYESDDEGDESVDQGPAGGRTWDGRVNRARDQAVIPLLSAHEMANPSEAAVVAHVASAPYAAQLRELYGGEIVADVPRAFAAISEALEVFQQTPAIFSPFTSKYDAFLRGQVSLSIQETRGLQAFNDPSKGNCIRCHKSQLTPVGNLPLFTDAGFVAIGVPRNPRIPANRDPKYYDLGMCGPERKDLADHPEYCGRFKAPTLRNVAVRHSFYHNGVFHSLEDAVAFYATRDTEPQRWYPKGPGGAVRKFDDLPARYLGNVDVEAPFDRKRGEPPALTSAEVADVVAFLKTLTDGFQRPGQAAAPAVTARREPGSP